MDNLDLDLHGKTWAEALEEFVDAYNRAVSVEKRRGTERSERSGVKGGHSCRTLTVIHGYGASGSGGVLRTRFRKFFEKHQSRMEFTPGEKVNVTNPGYTLVTPKYPLPGTDAALSELVWDYCEQAKPMGRVVGQFRRYGTPRVQQAVRSLENQKRLRKVAKGRSSAYQAI